MVSRELAKANYPLYAVKTTTKGILLVAGGGGSSSSGVPNGIVLYSLEGDTCTAVGKLDTGLRAVMNLDLHPQEQAIVTGQDGSGWLYSIKYERLASRKSSGPSPNPTLDSQHVEDIPGTSLENNCFKCEGTNPTDYSKPDAYQKVCRYSPDGEQFATGGLEGVVRIWKYPSFKLLKTLPALKDEVRDLVYHPAGEQLVCVTSAGVATVWDLTVENPERIAELVFDIKRTVYGIFGCCYVTWRGATQLLALAGLQGHGSYLAAYDTSSWNLVRKAFVHKEVCTRLALSPCRQYVAMGSRTGTVLISDTAALSHMTHSKPHGWFVTDLSWSADSSRVISVSADSRVCSTLCTRESKGPLNMTTILAILVALLALAISYFTSQPELWQ